MAVSLQALHEANRGLLAQAGIAFAEFSHEPVFSYASAEQVRQRFGLEGSESKSLFLRLRDGRYCMFVTLQGRRLDSAALKALLGSRPSLCSDAELTAQTGCLPHCACPFGHPPSISLVIDRAIFAAERFLYSPGPPEYTLQIAGADLPALLAACANPLFIYPANAAPATD